MNWVERKHRNAAHRRFTKRVHTRVNGYMAGALGKHCLYKWHPATTQPWA